MGQWGPRGGDLPLDLVVYPQFVVTDDDAETIRAAAQKAERLFTALVIGCTVCMLIWIALGFAVALSAGRL